MVGFLSRETTWLNGWVAPPFCSLPPPSEAASLLEPTGRGRDSLIEEWRPGNGGWRARHFLGFRVFWAKGLQDVGMFGV